jgi:hypothetical protein
MVNFFNKIWTWIVQTKNDVAIWIYSRYFDFIAFVKRIGLWSRTYFRNHYLWDRKAFLWILAIVLSYQMAGSWLWEKFNTLAVDKLLVDIKFPALDLSGLFFYFFLLVIPAVYGIVKIFKNSYKLSMVNMFLLLFVTYLYGAHRTDYSQYDLYKQEIHSWIIAHSGIFWIGFPVVFSKDIIGFFDPIYAIACVYVIILLANIFRFGIFARGTSILSQDIPIVDIASDKFDRSSYFNPLISELRQLAFDSERAFAVGINSMWGYGKTSLLEIMKSVFKDQEKSTVFMEYNPWMSAQKSGLTLDFFAQMEEVLSDHIETDNLIIKYGKALAKVDVDKNPFKKISGIFDSEAALKDRHRQVANLLVVSSPVFQTIQKYNFVLKFPAINLQEI